MNLLKHFGFKIFKISGYLATFTVAFMVYTFFKLCFMFN